MKRINIRVVNLRAEPYDVYIGRAGYGKSGIFGNPVAIARNCPVCGELHFDRWATLPCYEQQLKQRLKTDSCFKAAFLNLVERVQNEGTVTLGCFCKPQPCHGDVLARYIRSQFCKCGWHPCNPQEHAGWQPR